MTTPAREGHKPEQQNYPPTLQGEPTAVSDLGLDTLLPAPPIPPSVRLPPRAPEVVPGYEILQELGRGGMGVVYRARQVALNRVVALKMILGGSLADEQGRSRFRAEAEAIARLQHPNIVQIFDVGDHQGQPFFSLEYCPGGSLSAHLASKPLPPREAARLLVPLARGMHHAHAAGILHRDLKPGNILLASPVASAPGEGYDHPRRASPGADATGLAGLVPKIADFGLAKLLDGESRTCQGEIMGTPGYMAPEQAQGKIHLLGPVTDIYALGAILYECLTGRPPFAAATPMETLLEVNTREPLPVRTLQPKVPRDLETICLKCLHKDRARRYATAGELADDLERYLEGRAILARPVGPMERGLRWLRRHPPLAALALVLLVAVTSSIAGWAWFTTQLGRERDEADRHRLLAEERQREAETNGSLAQQNFLLAEARLLEALGVANRFFTEVSENTLLHEPGMEALRKKLLRNARDFYTGFLRDQGDDPRLAAELARSVHRLAVIDGELGDLAGGVAQLDDARKRFDRLLEATPRERRLLEGRAVVLNDLGRLERLRDRLAPASQAFVDARKAWEALLSEEAGSLVAKEGLARCLLGLGNVALVQQRRDEAQLYYREALTLREKLVAADERNDGYLRDLAVTWQNLALVQAQLKQQEAGSSNEQALALFRRLVEAHPTRGRYRADLAMASFNEGHRLMGADQFAPASKRYEESARGFEFLTNRHPDVPLYANRAGHALWNLGLSQEQLGKTGPADDAFKKAHKVRQALAEAHPDVPEYQVALAQCYHRVGDRLRDKKEATRAAESYGQARAILERAERTSPGSPQCRALLAEVLIELGGLGRKGGRFDEADRYYDEALELTRTLARQKQLVEKAGELERAARKGQEDARKKR